MFIDQLQRLFVLLMVSALLTTAALAQSNVINNGTQISIDAGVNVIIDNSLTNGAGGLFTNAGNVVIGGDFINNGGNTGFAADTGSVEFGEDSSIAGNSITSFNELVVAGDTSLDLDANVTDTVNLDGGNLLLSGNTLSILSDSPTAINTTVNGIVSESTDASGIVSWAVDTATGVFTVPFATTAGTVIPVSANITGPGAGAGNVDFSTYPTADDNLPLPPGAVNLDILDAVTADADVAVNRFWVAASTGFTTPPAYTLSLTPDPANDLSFSGGTLDGNLAGVQFLGGDWVDGNGGLVSPGSAANVVIDTLGSRPLAITGVNDQPSFLLGDLNEVFVGDSTEPETIPDFITDIDLGALDDIEQAANFIVLNDNPGLFSVEPSITPDGTLDFVPNASAAGSDPVTVSVTLTDGGGTEFGGVDESAVQTFSILFDVVEVPALSSTGLAILLLLLLAMAYFMPAGLREKSNHS